MILVFVFDGLRPDLVDAVNMPCLSALREGGAWFTDSHCVFPSVTRVNAASLATGSLPARHGIPSNTLWLRSAGGWPGVTAGTASDAVLRSLRSAPGADLFGVETLAAVLAGHDLRTAVVGAGSAGSAYLLHPDVDRLGGAVFHHTFTEPAGLASRVAARLGAPPVDSAAHTVDGLVARVDYAARALVEVLVPEVEPAVVFFWCTVPDALHHRSGLGSPEASAGLRRVDAIFGRLLDDLNRASAVKTDVIVTADHGYVTVDRHVDAAAQIASALAPAGHSSAAFAVAIDGSAGQVYCDPAAAGVAQAVVRFLNEQHWVSAVFAREPIDGAWPLADLGVEGERAGDVVFCFDWSSAANGYGVRGRSAGGGGIAIGAGDHGGGSPHELRNMLLAAGPSFLAGVQHAPAGIIDIAPTICQLLGVQAPARWSGRVLDEALKLPRGSNPAPKELTAEWFGGSVRRRLMRVQSQNAMYVRSVGKTNPSGL